MGQLLGRSSGETEANDVEMVAESTRASPSRKRKTTGDNEMETKKKKISKLDTAKYIHKRLFVDGAKSDITICALGRTWNLHRLYLEQCKFFDSLFRGHWKDSNNAVVQIDVVDPNVTVEGFNMVLESLYHNEIELDLENVASLVASASMLSLDSVMERCAELCAESLTDERVLEFYALAEQYGLLDLFEKCFQYLKNNFWRLSNKPEILHTVSHVTMVKLMAASDLLVVEGELDLYETIKKWIFLQAVPDVMDNNKMRTEMEKYYSSLTDRDRDALCRTFADITCNIRVGHIVSSVKTINDLRKDPLVPNEIIDQVLADNWFLLLCNEEMKEQIEIRDEDFHLNAHRLGRVLDSIPKCWRWSGFNFGVDLLLNYNDGVITLKRNCLSQWTPYSTNLKFEILLHYRLIVGNKHGKFLYDSTVCSRSFRIDQTAIIARFLPTAEEFPIAVHFFYLVTLPSKPALKYWEPYLKKSVMSWFNYVFRICNLIKISLQKEDAELIFVLRLRTERFVGLLVLKSINHLSNYFFNK
ncbi:BTB/POZ domain containing protein [Brugia malayi]|uniref:BMA-GCL-1 n=1 Tax=Brugia malayi TaxID=6279 RepID=A0A0K0JQC0_BRUMA|nr:BTB/POZ domain containing protein [Brugia malayi]CRZ22530.1 BMA-GCL-1 [Brugia malayi]VIO85954.1 BTB/POZ domain containing protein [Brugia malayi]